MLKILYAAANNKNALIQLSRFIKAMEGSKHSIKIAAYKSSSPPNISIDWTLDCLLNIFNPNHITLDNDNFITYFNQVKHYNPDLIISDLEYFTSEIASNLGTTLWQCSSSIINYALTNTYKYDLGIFKKYAFIFNRNPLHIQRMINIQDNSNCNFIYSHLGDSLNSPEIKDGFNWIRPYHKIGKSSILCKHNMVAGILGNNKSIINLLKHYNDSVCFTDFVDESYENPIIKNINNEEEYFCNLKNSNLFVCEGQTSFLADAYYNNKHSVVLTNFDDPECIINTTISNKLNFSKSIYNSHDDLTMNIDIIPYINPNIKYLHNRIEDL
jgi:hypothetical protein